MREVQGFELNPGPWGSSFCMSDTAMYSFWHIFWLEPLYFSVSLLFGLSYLSTSQITLNPLALKMPFFYNSCYPKMPDFHHHVRVLLVQNASFRNPSERKMPKFGNPEWGFIGLHLQKYIKITWTKCSFALNILFNNLSIRKNRN